MKLKLFVIAAVTFASASLALADPHAHVHGLGKLTIAAESPTKAIIAFETPTDSIFGFEHEAKTAKDKKTKEDALNKIKSNPNSVVIFDASLGCSTTVKSLNLEADHDEDEDHDKDHEEHGQHQNLKAEFDVVCKKSFSNSRIKIGLLTMFPKLKKIKVQILSETKQSEIEIKNATDQVSL